MPADRPTLHVTNWSSPKLHGPGRKWTVMAAPRAWEHGDGYIPELEPHVADLRRMKAGEVTLSYYRTSCIEKFRRELGDEGAGPGTLTGLTYIRNEPGANAVDFVAGGDTLCCACSKAEAAAGRCHRVWAAELLRRAGWRVLLDGRELAGVTPEWAPMFGEVPSAL